MKRITIFLSALVLGGIISTPAVPTASGFSVVQAQETDGMKIKMIDEFGNLHCHEDGGSCHTDSELE